jgi:hypothetical protein
MGEGKKGKRAKEYMDIKLTSLKLIKRRGNYQSDNFSVEVLSCTNVFESNSFSSIDLRLCREVEGSNQLQDIRVSIIL